MDQIHPRVLLEIKEEIAKPLFDLFNKTMANGQVPQEWRDALVTPIFKKGSMSQTNNYRPVSLTSLICKQQESIIRDHITNHLERNNILTLCQHGFVGGKSCSTLLLECFDKWTKILDDGGYLDIIYLNHAKAFDKVAHQRLLIKLPSYDVSGKILN